MVAEDERDLVELGAKEGGRSGGKTLARVPWCCKVARCTHSVAG